MWEWYTSLQGRRNQAAAHNRACAEMREDEYTAIDSLKRIAENPGEKLEGA